MIAKSLYSVVFDPTNAFWRSEPEHNELFLRNVMNHMNAMLQIRGHIFLNEIYDALAIPRTSHGAVVGWLYLHPDPEMGDGFINFDLNPLDEGLEIDFNVDGVIYHLLPGGPVL